jgi:hypothetical protein
MSNIHRLSDFENREAGGNRQGGAAPLLGTIRQQGDPRKESFFSFVKNLLCPQSTWKSFIFFISLIDIVVYIITLCFGIEESTMKAPTLLGPKSATLDKFGDLVINKKLKI